MSEKGEETGEETDPGLKVQAWHGTQYFCSHSFGRHLTVGRIQLQGRLGDMTRIKVRTELGGPLRLFYPQIFSLKPST